MANIIASTTIFQL